MFSAMRTSVSGLHAASKQVAASASNIVNSRNEIRTGDARTEPATAASRYAERATDRKDGVFHPVQVTQSSVEPAGVRAEYMETDPPHVAAYHPSSPVADEDGMIAMPNVSLEREFVNTIIAKRSYEANLKVIETEDEMLGTLMDISS